MMRMIRRVLWGLMVASLLWGQGVAGGSAAGPVVFRVAVRSAFLRAGPGFTTPPAYSVFQGQSFGVNARTADTVWLRLDFPGAREGATWILAEYGTLVGDVAGLPVIAATEASAPAGDAGMSTRAAAIAPVRYTVVARSLFARSAPGGSASWVRSLFKGETYTALARSADGLWLRLDLGHGAEGWVPLVYGSVRGDLRALPTGENALAVTPEPPYAGPALPAVGDRAREIYQSGLAQGNNPRAFSKVGDCMSVNPYFLTPFDKYEYRLGGQYAYLQEAIDQFRGSFARDSATARDGLNVTSVLDPIWANPKVCSRGESPLECEHRLNRPSIVFVSLGTNGAWQSNEEYEDSLRQILDFWIERGTLPILSTKADNVEGGWRFNQIVSKLATEYQLPLWDFWKAVQPLPNGGLTGPYQLGWGQAFYDDPAGPQRGWQVRNLTALQALDAVWKGVR